MSKEYMLITLLEKNKDDKNTQAIILQSYIAEFGPVTNELAHKVRELLK